VSRVIRRPSANRDLVEIFRYYARQAGMRVADRFFAQAEATFARLARMPGIGTQYEPDEPLYADLRYFSVARFRMYLVFYRPIRGGIEVLRILHGARDIASILADEFPVEENTGDDSAETEGRSEE
jgi:toxin ParE1/3/4